MLRNVCWCGALVATRAQAFDCGALLDAAAADWRQGRIPAVIATLRPEEARCAANARFDRVLGEALLADDQAAAALMPLERALALAPDDAASWRALSQARGRLGDTDSAHTARQALFDIDADTAAAMASPLHWQASTEGGAGYDSNATLAPYATGINVPALGNAQVILSPTSRQRGARYRSELFRAEGRWDVSTRTALSLSSTDTARKYQDLPVASSEEHTLAAKLESAGDVGIWTVGAMTARLEQGSDLIRTADGGSVGWRPTHASPWMPTLNWDLTRYCYSRGGMDDSPFDEQMLSLGTTLPLHDVTLGWTALKGSDETTPRHGSGDRDILGLRLFASGTVADRVEWFVWADHIDSRYKTVDPTFMTTRVDTLEDLTVGLSWAMTREFSLRTQLTLAQQHSTIPLYAYRRADFGVTLSYRIGN